MAVQDFSMLDLHGMYTYHDYLSWSFPERVELILGKIFPMSPAPQTQHQHAVTVLATTLHRQLKDRCRVFPAPFDVILATDHDFQNARTVLQPDITVVCDAEKLKTGGCFGAPDLVIEIISPSTVRRDLHEKLKLYEAFGVPEYWIVHPRDKTLVILSPGPDGRYQTSSLMTSGDTVHSRIFSGLQIDLEELFTDVVREPDPFYGEHVIRIA